MELGPKQKITDLSINPIRSPIRTKILSLDIGEYFEASDVEGSYVRGHVANVKKTAKREFSVRKSGRLKYLVIRKA